MLKRTQDEIVARIKYLRSDNHDILGFRRDVLYPFLDWEHAKEFVKDGITKKDWEPDMETDPETEIRNYMPFAWGKANDCRGISANRSIDHMESWLWLDGKDELSKTIWDGYEYYGKPNLVRVCKEYGINWKELDNDYWKTDEYDTGITSKQAIGE